MILTDKVVARKWCSIPRESGDDPCEWMPRLPVHPYSPRERG